MGLLRNILRVYSYLFETILCGLGIVLCLVLLFSPDLELRLRWLPWAGSQHQMEWIAALSVLGLVLVVLAVLGKMRVLLFLFSGYVAYLLIQGFFLSPGHTFSGAEDARNSLLFVLGSILAFIGAFPFGKRRRSA